MHVEMSADIIINGRALFPVLKSHQRIKPLDDIEERKYTGKPECALLVVDDFHIAVLFNPEFAHDDVVHTTGGVCPCVCFIVSKKQPQTQRSG